MIKLREGGSEGGRVKRRRSGEEALTRTRLERVSLVFEVSLDCSLPLPARLSIQEMSTASPCPYAEDTWQCRGEYAERSTKLDPIL